MDRSSSCFAALLLGPTGYHNLIIKPIEFRRRRRFGNRLLRLRLKTTSVRRRKIFHFTEEAKHLLFSGNDQTSHLAITMECSVWGSFPTIQSVVSWDRTDLAPGSNQSGTELAPGSSQSGTELAPGSNQSGTELAPGSNQSRTDRWTNQRQ